jgi:transmembrane sensor
VSKSDPSDSEMGRLKEASEWLQRLNESNEPSTADRWLEWCESDPLNPVAFEEMQRLWNAFPAVRARRSKRPSGLILLAAGMVLGALFVGWFIARPEIQMVDTSTGELRRIDLSDGSHIDLAPDSRVSARLTLTRRDIQLEHGQAFFAVAHSALRPFVVHVANLTVTTLGTAFDVRTGPNNTVVMVREGQVSVAPGIPSEAVRAAAGQRITFAKSAQRFSVASMDPSGAGSWRTGTLQFVGEPLEDVVSAVNRYSARRVIVSPSYMQTRFTGTLSPRTIREWLSALEQIYDVKVVDQGSNGILIRSRAQEGARL